MNTKDIVLAIGKTYSKRRPSTEANKGEYQTLKLDDRSEYMIVNTLK